jgi:hypothetical protein
MTTTTTATSTLTFQALPPAELRRIRAVGVDDFGHPLRVTVADGPGMPVRCCLREARSGDRVALISWRPLTDAPDNVYAEVGPIFIHAEECGGYHDAHAYPEEFRHRTQVLRSYTAAGDMHGTTIADGVHAETAIVELLDDPAAVVVHSRNVQAGCYMFAIRRAAG